jgi:hypothetical protein
MIDRPTYVGLKGTREDGSGQKIRRPSSAALKAFFGGSKDMKERASRPKSIGL